MKFIITGKSFIELYQEYGTGASGFYSSDPWWVNEAFAKYKPEAGEYDIDFGENLINLTFSEQRDKIKKGFEVAHPTIVAEAILSHFKKTGERILESRYTRTSTIDSGGSRVYVGRFDSDGLYVDDCWYDGRDVLGLSTARKIGDVNTGSLELLETLTYEDDVIKTAIDTVKKAGYQVSKIL